MVGSWGVYEEGYWACLKREELSSKKLLDVVPSLNSVLDQKGK